MKVHIQHNRDQSANLTKKISLCTVFIIYQWHCFKSLPPHAALAVCSTAHYVFQKKPSATFFPLDTVHTLRTECY